MAMNCFALNNIAPPLEASGGGEQASGKGWMCAAGLENSGLACSIPLQLSLEIVYSPSAGNKWPGTIPCHLRGWRCRRSICFLQALPACIGEPFLPLFAQEVGAIDVTPVDVSPITNVPLFNAPLLLPCILIFFFSGSWGHLEPYSAWCVG